MNVVTHPTRLAKFHLTSLILLAVILFSAVSHSHEFTDENSHSIEQLDCKLCQQLVEPPKQKVKLAKVTLGSFSVDDECVKKLNPIINKYRTSRPRAPPTIV